MSVRTPLAALLALLAAPAAAAPLALAVGEYDLTVAGALPDGVVIDETGSGAGPDPAPSASTVGDGFADAQASSEFDAGGPALLSGAVLAEAEAEPLGFAEGAAFASGLLVLENVGETDATVDFSLDYDLSALGEATGPDEDAEGQVTLELDYTGAGASFVEELTFGLENPGFGSATAPFAFSVELFAGAFAQVEVTLQATALAEDLAPIPLPAGLPLMAVGLGGLALLRRRA